MRYVVISFRCKMQNQWGYQTSPSGNRKVVFNSFKTLKYAQRSKAIALYAAVLNSTSNSMHTAFNDFEEYCDNLCDWYNIYDKEQLKADIEDAYHSQEITN